MKGTSTARIAVALLAVLLTACDGETHTTFDGQKLSGPLYTIDNVHGWQEQRGAMGADLFLTDTLGSPADAFAENINVIIEVLPAGMTDTEYLDISLQNARQMLNLTSTLDYKAVTVGGHKGHYACIEHRMGQMDLVADSYIVVRDGKAFSITCSALRDGYDAYKPKFDDVVKTFALK